MVLAFLAFEPIHADLAGRLTRAVTEHARPVGSGTVARTERIPIKERAEAAVIAWMRHQTTGYNSMAIPRIKGKRREVRRMLARPSQELLQRYRRGEPVGGGPSAEEGVGVEGGIRLRWKGTVMVADPFEQQFLDRLSGLGEVSARPMFGDTASAGARRSSPSSSGTSSWRSTLISGNPLMLG